MRSADLHLRPLALLGAALLLSACSMFERRPAAPPALPPLTAAPQPEPAKEPAREPAKDADKAGQASAQRYAAPAARPAAQPVPADVQRQFDAARQLLAANRVAEAERAFSALAKSHPELSGPQANLGLIQRQGARFTEAVASFERAVNLSPDRADLFNQLGISYRFAGQFGKAREAYEQALKLDPNYAPAVLNLGILHDLYLWDGQRALELYDRYLSLTPAGDDNVRRWISDLRNRAGQKDAAARKEQG